MLLPLTSSDGCSVNGPMGSQRWLPLTSLPTPGTSTSASRASDSTSQNQAE